MPLKPERLTEINTALDNIAEGLKEAELATRAGIDVETQRQQLLEAQAKLRQIKSVYFPNAA